MTGNEVKKTNGKYAIIHGHFYQPPRENPWINIIETQPSAMPHHDWNERIYDQCYRPNAYSRLLDANLMITGIENNYQYMSFNFGPTLFSWLEQHHPVTAKRIIEADKESCRKYNGHGNAVAQVYNHIIMPLSSRRDQLTQIRWSKKFFKRRFGRDTEGMWLAETAINMETVQCLIDEKIKFVILSPNQAESFRRLGDKFAQWNSTENASIDTRRPYRLFPRNQAGKKLSGHLDIFFFDEGLSKEISFGNLLVDSHILGKRISSCYSDSSENEVIVLATDGETFGHHKPFGDMCLAYYFSTVAKESGVTPVNFSYYLSLFPPLYEVSLRNAYGEGTAWSCAHGVGRWIRDCGCQTGGKDSWNQVWRGPLRLAFENLQEQVDAEFENVFSMYSSEPWRIRDEYIAIVNATPFAKIKKFLESSLKTTLDRNQVYQFRRLLEAQKYMLYSFTSCGWFFSEISGLEAMQNLSYACRALQLGISSKQQASVLDRLLEDLEMASSNFAPHNGKTLFEQHILPFYEHRKIVAFTASIMRVLGLRKSASFLVFEYSVKVHQLTTKAVDSVLYSCFSIELDAIATGEQFSLSTCVAHKSFLDIEGWVIDTDEADQEAGSNTPEYWTGNFGAKKYTFKDLFDTSRRDLESHFLKKISKDTGLRFNLWMQKNQQEIDLLSYLDPTLPVYCSAPLSFVINRNWDSLILQLKNRGAWDKLFLELIELFNSASRYGVTIDLSNSALVLENILIAELQNLNSNINGATCDRIRFLLNVVDRFNVPVSKNKLEDLFLLILKTDVMNLYQQYLQYVEEGKELDESGRDLKILLLKVISFAYRMNFNTDMFEIR